MVTNKENIQMLLNGEMPEFVPVYIKDFTIAFLKEFWPSKQGDPFGVIWTPDISGDMPDPKRPLLDSICNWRKQVRLPEIDSINWEEVNAGIKARHTEDKMLSFWVGTPIGGAFLPIINMLGVEEGLCALIEEPEACKEFVDYITDYYVKLIYVLGDKVKPDCVLWLDDLCTAQSLFFSYDIYTGIFRDSQRQIVKAIQEIGAVPQMHCCGNCELIVDDFVDMGVRIWEPVQSKLNDLKAIQKKHGSKLIFNGVWQIDQKRAMPYTSEEDSRQAVRDCMDEYFGDGGMIFHAGSTFGNSEDDKRRFAWVYDEAEKYGREFYKKRR